MQYLSLPKSLCSLEATKINSNTNSRESAFSFKNCCKESIDCINVTLISKLSNINQL